MKEAIRVLSVHGAYGFLTGFAGPSKPHQSNNRRNRMVATVCQQPTSTVDFLMHKENFAHCNSYLLDHEGEDFSNLLRTPDCESWGIESDGIPQKEWDELRNAYVELKAGVYTKGNEYVLDRIFDRLAKCSSGHVYCSAVKALDFLEKSKK